MKLINIVFLLCIAVALLNSCERIEPKPLREIRLTEEQEKWIPYSGNDTLLFKDNMGDTLKYFGKGCRIDTEYFSEGNKPPWGIGYSKVCFFFDKDSFYFRMGIVPWISSQPFYISWRGFASNRIAETLYTVFELHSYLKMDTKELKNDSLYFDSLRIENNTHFKVYKIFPKDAKPYSGKTMNALYYNLQYGILKIEFDNNNSWTLISR